MSADSDAKQVPRAMIHKKILDQARTAPTASMDEIAAEISGASVALVEQVLDEYGDPASADAATSTTTEPTQASTGDSNQKSVFRSEFTEIMDTADDDGADSVTDETSVSELDTDQDANAETAPNSGTIAEPTSEAEEASDPDPDDAVPAAEPTPVSRAPPFETLRESQQAVLTAIHATPDATQAELAEEFGVSAATICNRVNAIPGFEWQLREQFVESYLPATTDEPASDEPSAETGETATGDDAPQLDDFVATVETLTTQVESLMDRIDATEDLLESATALPGVDSTRAMEGLVVRDPVVIQKLLHAAMRSNQFSEEEELALIGGLVASPTK